MLQTSRDLNSLMDCVGDAHYVLLSEASYGTHKYCTGRTAILKCLVEEKSFSFIAVEGEWSACHQINCVRKGFHGGS